MCVHSDPAFPHDVDAMMEATFFRFQERTLYAVKVKRGIITARTEDGQTITVPHTAEVCFGPGEWMSWTSTDFPPVPPAFRQREINAAARADVAPDHHAQAQPAHRF